MHTINVAILLPLMVGLGMLSFRPIHALTKMTVHESWSTIKAKILKQMQDDIDGTERTYKNLIDIEKSKSKKYKPYYLGTVPPRKKN